jgi:hypothetical protein
LGSIINGKSAFVATAFLALSGGLYGAFHATWKAFADVQQSTAQADEAALNAVVQAKRRHSRRVSYLAKLDH